jgi:sarcosine oxidase subunit alpha
MAGMMSGKKDFIGRVMASRPGLTAADRPALVGIKPTNSDIRLRAGGHLLAKGASPVASNDQGYVTSVAFSPTLGHSIGLALLRSGPTRHGEIVRVYDPLRGTDTDVEVCNPVFVDPKGICVRG